MLKMKFLICIDKLQFVICGKMFISIKEQFIIIRCTSIGGNKDMILKYKNEYNDYYEF